MTKKRKKGKMYIQSKVFRTYYIKIPTFGTVQRYLHHHLPAQVVYNSSLAASDATGTAVFTASTLGFLYSG